MSKKKFKIYTTNGKDIWEIIFITFDEKNGDFYYGIINEGGIQTKTSRHVSGKFHSKSSDNLIYHDHGQRVNLNEFKGFESLSCIAMSPDSFKLPLFIKTYSGGKFTGSAFIDSLRNYKQININLFLLEPAKTDELTHLSDQMGKGQIIIFTQKILGL